MKINVIHPTTLDKLSTCRLQFHWSRTYKSMYPSEYQVFGLAIHYAMEKFYSGRSNLADAFQEYMDDQPMDYDKIRSLGIAMLTNYQRHYYGDPFPGTTNENFEVVATEMEIARKIPVPYDEVESKAMKFYVAARIDAIVLDLNLMQYFVLEHKTFDKFFPIQLSLDHQFVLEKFIAEGYLKRPVTGVIYNGLRKKAVMDTATKLFERHYLHINDKQVETALHRVYWQLKELHSPQFRIYPEPSTMKCNMCEFKRPCEQKMRGGDYEFLLGNLFVKREDTDTEWETQADGD